MSESLPLVHVQRDQEEAAAVFADFVADFAEPTTKAKTFVKSGGKTLFNLPSAELGTTLFDI